MADKRKIEDERVYWTRRRQDARAKINEIDTTREKLKELTKSYDQIFARACNSFAEADRMLAELEGKHRYIAEGVSGKPARNRVVDPKALGKDELNNLIKQLQKLQKEI